MRYARVFLGGTIVAFALAHPSKSWGQTADSVAIADALFEEAQQLIRENRVSEACVKFEESDRADPGLGTKLSLADCYEREGKLAAAWITFTAIIPAARQANRPDREAFAKGRAETLAPRVPKLLITLGVADATSVEVLRDGVVVDAAALVLPLPVEAGKHAIVVRSAGFFDWSTEVVAEEGKTLEVKVPALQAKVVDVPPPSPDVVVPVPLPNAPSGVRTGGFITLGLGGAGVLTWAVAGAVAMSKKSFVEENCPTEPCANLGASNAAREAFGAGKTAASVATAGLVVGVVGLVAGGVMVLSGSSRRPPAQAKSGVQVMVDVSLSGGMFGVQGVFQ